MIISSGGNQLPPKKVTTSMSSRSLTGNHVSSVSGAPKKAFLGTQSCGGHMKIQPACPALDWANPRSRGPSA